MNRPTNSLTHLTAPILRACIGSTIQGAVTRRNGLITISLEGHIPGVVPPAVPGGSPVSALLRLAAAVSLGWAVLLIGFKHQLLVADHWHPLMRSLANGLGVAYLALGYSFWYAARNPSEHRGTIYAALILMAFKMVNDVYEVLALLPGELALISLADLVLSTGLLVGLLEALPRTFASAKGGKS